jgi:type I restriction enzyme S subunit
MELESLNEHWIVTKFTSVLDIQGGTQPPKSQFIDKPTAGYVRLLQIRDFGNKPVPTYVPDTKQLKKCKKDDLLIGRYGASLGRICTGMEGAYNVALTKLVSGEYLDRHFLKGYLESELFQHPLSLLSRSAQNGFNKEDLANFDFVLPPLAEQKIIAEKLDSLLAQVESTKARLERIPDIIKRFRQSVLSAAVSGRLTEEWRKNNKSKIDGRALVSLLMEEHEKFGGHSKGNASDPTEVAHDLKHSDIPKEWGISLLRDACVPGRPITYGILKPGPELEQGIPYIRVADFPGNKLNLRNIKKTSKEIDEQFKRSRLQENDLLLSIRGSVGRLIKIPKEMNRANITQDTARLSISGFVSVDYIYYTLLSDSVQRRMNNAVRGVAVRGINIGDVRALQIPMPSLDEQKEIVRRVQQLFAFADTIEQKTNAALERVNNLTQSILAKAFRGELTAEWRAANPDLITGENSAAALLERIKKERETTTAKPNKRKAKA